MGCVSTKALQSTVSLPTLHANSDNDQASHSTSNLFHVSTSNGRKKITATLEVSDSELILHRPRHPPIRWPLHFLRRYGYEDGVFSFESGRRCSSGPGVFTFGCAAAEELFQLVQSKVQDNAAAQFSSGMVPIILRERSASAANASLHPEAMARAAENGYLKPNSALLGGPSSDEGEPNHTLVNIRPPLRRPASLSVVQPVPTCSSPQHAYINVGVPVQNGRPPLPKRNGFPRVFGSTPGFSPEVPPYVNLSAMQQNGRTNSPLLDYVQLNMGSPSRSPGTFRWISASQSLNRHDIPRSNYAAIDFAKTKAIRQLVRTPVDLTPAVSPRRPSRHESLPQ